MCHIVDKVVLYLRITLLSEYYHNGEDEGDQQHQCKDDTWYHEAHTREDITVHVREMHLHNSHLRLRIVAEQYLRIAVFLTLF